jgi:hypothetical protein
VTYLYGSWAESRLAALSADIWLDRQQKAWFLLAASHFIAPI